MAEKKTEVIDLSGSIYDPETFKADLRQVRAVIVDLLGFAQDVNPGQLALALSTLQYLTEDVEYKR